MKLGKTTKILLVSLVAFIVILVLMLPVIIPMVKNLTDDGNEYGDTLESLNQQMSLEHGPTESTPERAEDNKKLNSENPTDDVELEEDDLELEGSTIGNVDRPTPDRALPADSIAAFGSELLSA